MNNSYKKNLDCFFEKLLYYRHISGQINRVFQNEIEVYSNEKSIIHFSSALILSDWTGSTDNGWEKNFHSGIFIQTAKENYKSEIEKIYSKQLCLLYAQSFESFERFLKDCLFDRIVNDENIKKYVITLFPKNQNKEISRAKMPSGENLFKAIKKAGGESFKVFSSNNNQNIRFKEMWTILSEVRHSITHNESMIDIKRISQTTHHKDIFNYLFNSKKVSEDLILIELEYRKFEKLIKRFSEFAFQIFKILSVEENQVWDITE